MRVVQIIAPSEPWELVTAVEPVCADDEWFCDATPIIAWGLTELGEIVPIDAAGLSPIGWRRPGLKAIRRVSDKLLIDLLGSPHDDEAAWFKSLAKEAEG